MLKAPAAVSFAQPLIARGSELRNVEPVVAYFCFYNAVQQVLDAKLHTTSTEVSDFATNLLNVLEEMKTSDLQDEEAKSILESDEASRAYVLNFAATVFAKMQSAVDQLKITKATGAGFMAAATFLSLEKVWSPLSTETSEKIKYSKYHAARILSAVKKGEDPNEQYRIEAEQTKQEEIALAEEEEQRPDEANPDEHKPDEANPDVEPELEKVPSDSRSGHDSKEEKDLALPAAPSDDPSNDLELPGAPKEDLNNDLSLPEVPDDQPEGNASPPLPRKESEADDDAQEKQLKTQPPRPRKPGPTVKPVSQALPINVPKQQPNPAEILALTKATGSAQKHAKYAISALNYDDIKTAMSELESALAVLKLYESHNAS